MCPLPQPGKCDPGVRDGNGEEDGNDKMKNVINSPGESSQSQTFSLIWQHLLSLSDFHSPSAYTHQMFTDVQMFRCSLVHLFTLPVHILIRCSDVQMFTCRIFKAPAEAITIHIPLYLGRINFKSKRYQRDLRNQSQMTNMRSNDKYEVPIRRLLPTKEEPGSRKKIVW